MLLEALITVFVLVIVWFLFWPSLKPIYGIYRLPGKFYWIKKLLFQTLLWYRWKRFQSLRAKALVKEIDGAKVVDYGKSDWELQQLEGCQILPDDDNAIDCVYFGGYNKEGVRLALRLGRRHGRCTEVWIVIVIPGVGNLQLPLHPDTTVVNTLPDSYNGGGLKIELLEPLRRWKVSFNGQLRCNHGDKEEEVLYTRFSFIWESVVDPFNYNTDMDISALADAVAREEWSKEFWERVRGKHQTHYVQWGGMHGSVEVEGFPKQQISVASFRDHTIGVRDWQTLHRYVIHYIVLETGEMIMVGRICFPLTYALVTIGVLTYASGQTWTVSDMDFPLWNLEYQEPPDQYSFSFIAGGKKYSVSVSVETTAILYHGEDRGSKVYEKFCQYVINGVEGFGFVEFHYGDNKGEHIVIEESVPLLSELSLMEVADRSCDLIISLDNRACCCSDLVGGKGTQLAQLMSIKDQPFVVPMGFCVTLAAFELQVKSVLMLNDHRCSLSDLPSMCSDVVEEFATCSLSAELEQTIQSHFMKLLGDKEIGHVAVRSSAAGEDGSEASSAGQMETFLGVHSVDEVCNCVRKCWASAYTYQAVEYRRQHGQPIVTSVGVVIQEMVQSEVSGVLFTNDPLTGNPGLMTLDASYGLGEVVVSGRSDPDTITVSRTWKNQLKIKEKRIGKKASKILLSDRGGVEEVSNNQSGECCLSDDLIIKLCHAGVEIEKHYGSGRDIEWSVSQGEIFLLQARPITTLDMETDEELIHEFDNPLISDREVLTTANVGEMIPGAVTPLTMSVFARSADQNVQMFSHLFGQHRLMVHASKTFCRSSNKLLINLMITGISSVGSLFGNKKVMELNLAGETIPENTVENIIKYMGREPSLPSKIWWFFRFLYISGQIYKKCDEWARKLEYYTVGKDGESAESLYKEIDDNMCVYDQVLYYSIVKSGLAGSYNAILMGVLSGNNEWKLEHYSDVAMLLSECEDVYSAEVPVALEELAKEVVDAGIQEKFNKSDDTVCVEMLQSAEHSKLQARYQLFIDHHGHRCVREAELREKSWRREPTKLIKVLKTIIKTKSYNRKEKRNISVSAAIDKLKTPLSFFNRFLLKMFVPKARKSVGQREWGKSVAVKMMNVFKEAYWKLADLMLQEGRLPEKDLIFFLTHKEIGKLLKTRSPKLITRAVRRRKILPRQMEVDFPKIIWGYPKPVNLFYTSYIHHLCYVYAGLPVSHGLVTGRARVVKTLEDADLIQAGEILIVVYTDVGWSPYFPLILGLVTELGGLVSHGAVVAREYGIPCVVSIPQVTDLFKTGDFVHLDGITGTVQKLEEDCVSSPS
ncbi:hypothetical protein ScPMuIL_015549 [Solemya velum]